jgi:VanZ family protein
MTFNRNFIRYWLPVIFWMCFIFWMSTETFSSENTFSWIETVLRFLVPEISHQDMGLIHALIRKAAHVIEYFILGLLLFQAFNSGSTGGWN